MKRTTILLLSLLIYTALTSSECNKPKMEYDNPYGLPNATQTGTNNFACLINGKAWIANKSIFSTGGGISRDSLFAFGGNGPDVYFQSIYLKIKKNISVGVPIQLNDENNFFHLGGDHNCSGFIGNFRFRGEGVVLLTRVDSVGKIISGTFSCIIPVPNCDTLTMTDGRFDIHF